MLFLGPKKRKIYENSAKVMVAHQTRIYLTFVLLLKIISVPFFSYVYLITIKF